MCIRSFGRCHTVRPPTDKTLATTQDTSQASDDVQNVGQLLVILLSLKGHLNQLLYSPQLTCQAAATSSSLDSMHSRKSKQGLNGTSGRLSIQAGFYQICMHCRPSLWKLLVSKVPNSVLNFNPLPFLEGAIQLPGQLTYPTLKELLWKGCLIMLSIMALMVIISTFDTTFLYLVVKQMRRSS